MRIKSNVQNLVHDMNSHSLKLVALALSCSAFLTAQPADDTQLKQVILFGRHGVRTPVLPNTVVGPGIGLDTFSALPFPTFPPASASSAPLGLAVLTPNGASIETILGGYFRLWLTQEGLLTGNDSADANFVYFWANDTPLITQTAQAFALGCSRPQMLPSIPSPRRLTTHYSIRWVRASRCSITKWRLRP